jgi:hypothetical protein
MSRFSNLKKIPAEPAARLLAGANTKLATKVPAPASAPVDVVLQELQKVDAWVDMMRLMSVALPPRERVWWACLAGRDMIEADEIAPTRTLITAEEWVFRPGEETLVAVHAAMESADMDDPTTLCATAAVFAEGTLGPGELAKLAGPPGGSAAAAFGMNVLSLTAVKSDLNLAVDRLLDRALDIASGGNGRAAQQKDR